MRVINLYFRRDTCSRVIALSGADRRYTCNYTFNLKQIARCRSSFILVLNVDKHLSLIDQSHVPFANSNYDYIANTVLLPHIFIRHVARLFAISETTNADRRIRGKVLAI